MKEYFFKRLLLIPPTLLGVTIIVFAITRLVPGGPLERAAQESEELEKTLNQLPPKALARVLLSVLKRYKRLSVQRA